MLETSSFIILDKDVHPSSVPLEEFNSEENSLLTIIVVKEVSPENIDDAFETFLNIDMSTVIRDVHPENILSVKVTSIKLFTFTVDNDVHPSNMLVASCIYV